MAKSKLSPHGGCAVLRQLNAICKKGLYNFFVSITICEIYDS